jgi:hypothetical protein
MHSSELKEQDNIYWMVLRAVEYLDEGEFLEGIMWFEDTAKHVLNDIDEWPERPEMLDDCREIQEMIQNEDWPGVLENMEKIRGHMEALGYYDD